jgi:hypothetical protein
VLPEGLALLKGKRQLHFGRLARAVWAGKGASSPGGSTADFGQICQGAKDGLVAEGNEDHAVVDKSAHGADDGGFLTAARGGGADEGAGVFAPVGSGLPLAALRERMC